MHIKVYVVSLENITCRVREDRIRLNPHHTRSFRKDARCRSFRCFIGIQIPRRIEYIFVCILNDYSYLSIKRSRGVSRTIVNNTRNNTIVQFLKFESYRLLLEISFPPVPALRRERPALVPPKTRPIHPSHLLVPLQFAFPNIGMGYDYTLRTRALGNSSISIST